MTIRFDGKVAIVTGAGQGLGQAHAMALAARGAFVVVNDLGGSLDGSGGSSKGAELVVETIKKAGGDAMPNAANVADYAQVQAMVDAAIERWGRVDILVNNAGILRDKSLAKIDMADFRTVMEVHLFGAINCTRACWPHMIEQNYGRVIFTTSSAGLYGNFGQSAYSSAKAGLIGLMKTLSKEVNKYDIRVNCVSPAAATRMTHSLLTPEQIAMLEPEAVSAGLCFLASQDAPNRTILTAGAGSYAVARMVETKGVFLHASSRTPETIAKRWKEIADADGQVELINVEDQTKKFLDQAVANRTP